MIQFHGDEPPAFCRQFERPWIKALRVRPGLDITGLGEQYVGARAILLDAWEEGVPGGTGKTFDWALAPGSLSQPVVLAGGLNPHNVGAAFVAAVRAAEKGVETRTDDQ